MLTIRHVTSTGTRHIGVEDVAVTRPGAGFVWVDVVDPSPDESAALDRLDLPALVLEDMREDQHLPKVERMAGTLSLTVHGLDVSSLADELRTVELDCALREDLLVTYREGRLASVAAVGRSLDDGTLALDRPFVLLHRLLDVMNDVLVPFVDHLDRRLDVIEEDILDEPGAETRYDLYRLQRDVIQLRRVVLPQAEVVRRIGRDRAPGWQPGDEALVRDLHGHLDRMVALCDSYQQLLESAMDSYRSSLDDRLNRMLTTLTIVSTVLLPVSVVAGLWGMNFVMVPGAADPNGFWYLLVASGGLIALMLLWFTAVGWIGGRAQRRARRRRHALSAVLEVPVLGRVVQVPVRGGRAVGRLAGQARRAIDRR